MKLTRERCNEVAQRFAESCDGADPHAGLTHICREREAMARLAGLALAYEARHAARAAEWETDTTGDWQQRFKAAAKAERKAHAALLAYAREVSR